MKLNFKIKMRRGEPARGANQGGRGLLKQNEEVDNEGAYADSGDEEDVDSMHELGANAA